jgi:hypothetical protein
VPGATGPAAGVPAAEETTMKNRVVTCLAIGIAVSIAVALTAQSTKTSSLNWSVPRMPDGHPDLQGVWANNTMTPLERPPQFAGRATMTDAELADLKARVKQMMDGGDAFFADELILAALDGKTKFSSADTQTGNYDQTWLSERIFDNRTSLIIDPPDGRIPPPAPGAAERARAQATARQQAAAGNPLQTLSLSTRCISGGTPNIRTGYQSYFEITQGPAVVALRTEMIHDARVFSINAGPHVSSAITQYHGDSRAHWEGDTLVVDTTNFSPNANFRGATTNLHVIEKFKRVADTTLEYYVTIDDASVWSRPWTLMIPLAKTGELMFEYACHEGNYGLRGILSAAKSRPSSVLA